MQAGQAQVQGVVLARKRRMDAGDLALVVVDAIALQDARGRHLPPIGIEETREAGGGEVVLPDADRHAVGLADCDHESNRGAGGQRQGARDALRRDDFLGFDESVTGLAILNQ